MYPALGTGGHVFIVVRKTNWSTPACIRQIARVLGIKSDDIGHAGMKDRHARTTQTLSIPWPEEKNLPSFDWGIEGIEVLSAQRHPHKLRVGHLIGNRFRIRLGDMAKENMQTIKSGLHEIGKVGVPNAYGPQRFGKDGDNAQRALGWLRGEFRGPKNKSTRRLLQSSVQSMLFDRLLHYRVRNGTWNTVVEGDLVKTFDRGGLFMTEHPQTDAWRALVGEVTATGPIFGSKMRWPGGEPAKWERNVVDEVLGGPDALGGLKKLGVGSRRALRILPQDFQVEYSEQNDQPLVDVSMTLPKGAYATTVLGAVFQLRDASLRRTENSLLNE